MSPIPEYSVEFLMNYDWPGNVRELESFLEKYVILLEDQSEQVTLLEELARELQPKHSAPPSKVKENQNTVEIALGSLKEMELEIIRKFYESNNMDKETLAQKLGISRTTLWKKLKELS